MCKHDERIVTFKLRLLGESGEKSFEMLYVIPVYLSIDRMCIRTIRQASTALNNEGIN
jgi:hypothetical protein